MKNKFLFLIFTIIFATCQKSPFATNYKGEKYIDCLAERKNESIVENQIGIVKLIMDNYVIVFDQENQRYLACNLPEKFKKADAQVQFSLVVKEILPTERLIASPAVIIKIEFTK